MASRDPVVQTATDINTTGWQTFDNKAMGLRFQFPPTYVIHDSGSSIDVIGPTDNIEISFARVMSSIPAEVASHFDLHIGDVHWLNYGIGLRDANTDAVAMIVQTGSSDFDAIYFFTNQANLPFPNGGPKTYPIILANVLTDGRPPAGLSLNDTWLNDAQQILATVQLR